MNKRKKSGRVMFRMRVKMCMCRGRCINCGVVIVVKERKYYIVISVVCH